jgi:hypothetical protein
MQIDPYFGWFLINIICGAVACVVVGIPLLVVFIVTHPPEKPRLPPPQKPVIPNAWEIGSLTRPAETIASVTKQEPETKACCLACKHYVSTPGKNMGGYCGDYSPGPCPLDEYLKQKTDKLIEPYREEPVDCALDVSSEEPKQEQILSKGMSTVDLQALKDMDKYVGWRRVAKIYKRQAVKKSIFNGILIILLTPLTPILLLVYAIVIKLVPGLKVKPEPATKEVQK